MKLRNIHSMREYLNENQVNIPKPSKNFLYHGTNIKNLDDIKSYGLLPDFGDVVKSTEMYQYYINDEYFNPEDRVDGVLFFSNNPDTWSYSNYGEKGNLNDAVLVIVENNETIYHKKDDSVYDINGEKVNVIKYDNSNYLDSDKIPPFIEQGDYFSFDEQTPFDILYGDRLIKFLEQF